MSDIVERLRGSPHTRCLDPMCFEGHQVCPHDEDPYHDDIKPTQEERYADWLAQAQAAITKLSKERADGIVSTDDIWDICPPPPGVEPRALGALWAPRSRWVKIDYVPSTRSECHKRPIARWRYIRADELQGEAAE